MVDYHYLTDSAHLAALSKALNCPEIAVDVECENNLHRFGARLSLIQISVSKDTWIIDVVAMKDMSSLKGIFESESIQKVFHDVSFDLRILFHELGWKIRNIYDTQLAARFQGKEKIGLGSLLEEYFNIHKEHKFQRFDWLRRPLPAAVLDYAAKDTIYLLPLKRRLEQELQQRGRKQWVDEECYHLQEMDWSYHEQTYMDLGGIRSLSDVERGRVKALFALRQDLAKEVDRPSFMIFTNKQILEFAKSPPASWHHLRVHPLVKRNASLFQEAMRKAQPIPRETAPRFTPEQKQGIDQLLEARDAIAQNITLAPSLLISIEEVHKVVCRKSISTLRPWQKVLLEKPLKMVLGMKYTEGRK